MKARINGSYGPKFHLYAGCKILEQEDFLMWSYEDKDFNRLWEQWQQSGYQHSLIPTVDRVDSFYGYELFNMEWVTKGENSRRANLNGKA